MINSSGNWNKDDYGNLFDEQTFYLNSDDSCYFLI